MSKADEIFIRNVKEILNEGYSDRNLDVLSGPAGGRVSDL